MKDRQTVHFKKLFLFNRLDTILKIVSHRSKLFQGTIVSLNVPAVVYNYFVGIYYWPVQMNAKVIILNSGEKSFSKQNQLL